MAGGGGKEDLETLFARRRELDRALMEQHAREVALLFTDIVGSTAYFEQHGDLAGLELVQRHNALLFPVVAAHAGWIVKTIGDAIMAVFEEPAGAVRCAVQMQQVLARANAEAGGEPIRIRVGAHFGRALVDDAKDVYGDAVNTAARVVNEADGGQIVISCALASRLPEDLGQVLVPWGSFQPKGKAEPLPVVLVHWEDGAAPAPKAQSRVQPVRASAPGPAPLPRDASRGPELFVLEVQASGPNLKVVALDGAADKGTVKAYAEVPCSAARLDELTAQYGTFMRGGGEASYVARVAALGSTLFDEALSDRARRRLKETQVDFLRLQLDDALVHVPWELLHDGEEFLALRLAMGRVVSARAEVSPSLRAPSGNAGGHALVVSNPSGDLPAALREGEAVAGLLADRFAGEVRHLRGPVGRRELLAALKGCAVLHFAGHAERPSQEGPGGFRLLDGVATPEEVAAAVGDAAPALVFANSCWSSSGAGFRGDEGGPDLASALLLRGTRHFVGPRWDIADVDALAFALRFYERALGGERLGEAVRDARQALRSLDHRPLSFAGYVLYGEPRDRMPGAVASAGAQVMTRSVSTESLPVSSAARRAARPPRGAQAGGGARRRLLLAAGALLLLGAAAVAVFATGPSRAKPPSADAVKGVTDGPPRVDRLPASRTGPVRLSMLEFRNIGGDAQLAFLSAGLTESMMTDFGEQRGVRLIERAQLELDLKELEFSQSKYVDPKARAELGKIAGAEVVVLGGFQRAGNVVRAHARFVDVETGEVLHALRVEQVLKDGDDGALFDLQNKLSEEVRTAVPQLLRRVRP